jgi:hypothetical protein
VWVGEGEGEECERLLGGEEGWIMDEAWV